LRLLALARRGLLALAEAVGLGLELAFLALGPFAELLERALVGQDMAVVVIRVLEVIFRHDAVAGSRRIAAKHKIFLINLMGRTAQPDTRAVAVEGLVAALVMVVVMMLARLALLASAPSAHEPNPL
jgi:hypothetical protein